MLTGHQPGNMLPAGRPFRTGGLSACHRPTGESGRSTGGAGAHSSALPDPATFAMLVVQLILLGLFAYLLRDLRFDAARTDAALAGLAEGFSRSRAMIGQGASTRPPVSPVLEEAAAAWKSVTRNRLGGLARTSWLARPALALTLTESALFTAGSRHLSLTAERWLAPAVDLLEQHPGALLLLSRSGHENMGDALARLDLLRADLEARGAPPRSIALRLDGNLVAGHTALILVAPAERRGRLR